MVSTGPEITSNFLICLTVSQQYIGIGLCVISWQVSLLMIVRILYNFLLSSYESYIGLELSNEIRVCTVSYSILMVCFPLMLSCNLSLPRVLQGGVLFLMLLTVLGLVAYCQIRFQERKLVCIQTGSGYGMCCRLSGWIQYILSTGGCQYDTVNFLPKYSQKTCPLQF